MQTLVIKTGKQNMDVEFVHRYLSEESYWAKGISYEFVDNSLSNSFCVGGFTDGKQIGFGRVITDYYTFGWFADFFVASEYQGKGVAKQMLAHILKETWSSRLRRMMLNTNDAHDLYSQFGFTDLKKPHLTMERHRPGAHLECTQEENSKL